MPKPPLFAAACLLLAVLPAQTQPPAPPAQPPAATQPPAPPQDLGFVVRSYPKDRNQPIAVVADRPLTLGDLVDHLEARHHPRFREALETRPEVQRMLQSDLIAPWVRHFADLRALQHLTKDLNIDPKKLEDAQSAALKARFQSFLDQYIAQRREAGRPTDLSQQLVNRLLADFQLRNGLACELQGFLDLIEPDDYTRGQLQDFYRDNPRMFGGTVALAHILIHNRDPGTGILLDAPGLAKAAARLADVRARLRPDGSNFEEVAQLCSADAKTAAQGGLLGNVHRCDDRLPAVLCRAAWTMNDGQVSDVIESPYGWHLVKRLEFVQHILVLFTDDAIPTIREGMRRVRQEDWLFKARAQAKLELLL
ncbi:MAG: peptidylprolyl isomerase [Planctomycetes bacterium]|nr:peptidylprolyl isomerase [Planctomycetota bacterium]